VRAPPAAGAGAGGASGSGRSGGSDFFSAASAAAPPSRDGATGGVWHAGGLAQRVFADLGIPSRAWPVRTVGTTRMNA
jgi:hypothetical protein